MILSIDLGGTSAKCAIIKQDKIIYKFEVKTVIGSILKNLKSEIDSFLVANNIKNEEIETFAFCIPGAYNKNKGEVIFAANLDWWNYPINNEIKKIFETKNFTILNDTKAATYGEWRVGQDAKVDSVALYTIGTGIGTGLVLNRNLWLGTKTLYGSEGGHGSGYTNEPCSCGLVGCIESTASATGIERELNKIENKTYIEKKLNKSFDKVTIKDISNLFNHNDEVIVNVFKKCLDPLVRSIATVFHWLDVDKILIGGGVSNLGHKCVELIYEILEPYMLPSFYKEVTIEIAKLTNDAGIWGNYYWSIDSKPN